MARAGVKLNSAGFKALLNSGDVRADLTDRAQRVLSAAQSGAPVKSGTYRDGLHIVQATTDRAVVRVSGGTRYDHLVEAQSGNLARALDAGR